VTITKAQIFIKLGPSSSTLCSVDTELDGSFSQTVISLAASQQQAPMLVNIWKWEKHLKKHPALSTIPPQTSPNTSTLCNTNILTTLLIYSNHHFLSLQSAKDPNLASRHVNTRKPQRTETPCTMSKHFKSKQLRWRNLIIGLTRWHTWGLLKFTQVAIQAAKLTLPPLISPNP